MLFSEFFVDMLTNVRSLILYCWETNTSRKGR